MRVHAAIARLLTGRRQIQVISPRRDFIYRIESLPVRCYKWGQAGFPPGAADRPALGLAINRPADNPSRLPVHRTDLWWNFSTRTSLRHPQGALTMPKFMSSHSVPAGAMKREQVDQL